MQHQAERDILFRATYPLLGISILRDDGEKLFFKKHRFSPGIVSRSPSRYNYETRADNHERSRTRYLIDFPDSLNGEMLILAIFDMRMHRITLFEHGRLIIEIKDLRIILNLIERQISEVRPDIKVERLSDASPSAKVEILGGRGESDNEAW